MADSISPTMQAYFDSLTAEVMNCYGITAKARALGLDPELEAPIPLAKNMAERVVGLISVAAPQVLGTGITLRILELEKEYGQLDWRVGFKIAEEVAKQMFCTFETKIEAMEVGIRIGFAYLTLGIVSAPLEGFIGLKLKKRRDGKEYFALQYAGPIRAAGGTAGSTSVILSDYVRVKMGYATYDPDESEINRYVTEIHDYHERVTNLQYHPSDEEIKFMISHLPVEIDGDATEQIEVSNYKDLPRIETNLIRGGMALVVAEGLTQKTPKLWKRLSKWGKTFDLEWEWLADFIKLKEQIHSAHSSKKSDGKGGGEQKRIVKPNNTFIMDLVAGRPILTHPMGVGGFRLRYGRARTSGFSATAIHPATLLVLEKYIAIGTQLKVERPGKAATVTVCDVLEGPIVKLKDGSVMQFYTDEQARQHLTQVDIVLFLGDILFNYGDFSENGQMLVPAGYCCEWWALEAETKLKEMYLEQTFEKGAIQLQIEKERLEMLLQDYFYTYPTFEEAVTISKELNIPFHPDYTFYWKLISYESFIQFIDWLKTGKLKRDLKGITKIILPYFEKNKLDVEGKKVLDEAGIAHLIVNKDNLVIEEKEAKCLGLHLNIFTQEQLTTASFSSVSADQTALDVINSVSSIKLRDKAGTFIGARMGRPEKAKMREMTGSPQVMFPVGEEGDRLRSFQSAMEAGKIKSQFPLFYCTTCNTETIYSKCERCGLTCIKKYHCRVCGNLDTDTCRHGKAVAYKNQEIDIKYYFLKAKELVGMKTHPDLVKGIRGTSNKDHIVEHLAKGLLRAKHSICVNKEGTTRYDCTELPLTHFKPKEIKTSVAKLRELGYVLDIYGKELVDDNQVLELKVQDVILPGYGSLDESAPKVLSRVANFLDDLLINFYKLEPYYNIKKEEDLVGHLIVGLAPHISAGLVGRIIGFSDTQGMICHPMYHAGMRRDCVHPKTRFVYENPQRKGYLYIEEIGAFVENLLLNGAKKKIIDSVGTIQVELAKPLTTWGIDPITKKLKQKVIKYFIKGPTPDYWIKITTATNRTFYMTPTHDFLYLVDQQIKFKKAKEIVVGDKIPLLSHFTPKESNFSHLNFLSLFLDYVPKQFLSNIFISQPVFFKSFVELIGRDEVGKVLKKKITYRWPLYVTLFDVKLLISAGLLSVENLQQSNAQLQVKFSSRKFSFTLPINTNLVYLLGFYAAEGYCRKNKSVSQVAFRVGKAELGDKIIKMIKSVFGITPNLGEDNTKITICDQFVYLFFKYCLHVGSNAYDKHVPAFMFGLKSDLVASYLSAFIDGDGSVVPEGNFVTLYSVNRSLLDDMALLLTRFGIVSRYHTTPARFPGKKVLEIYQRLGKEPVSHILHHLSIKGNDAVALQCILYLRDTSKRNKLMRLKPVLNKRRTRFDGHNYLIESQGDIIVDYIKKIERVDDKVHSYCLEVDWKSKEERNVLWGEQIINTRCDGDEACAMLLMDALLNFSRKFLPNTRGSTMDAALVLTGLLNPTEVDDQVHGVDTVWRYPLEFYEAALELKNPWDVRYGPEQKKIEQISDRLGKPSQYEGFGFTHPTDNFNKGVNCSAYKTEPSMADKLVGQMEIARKVRAVDMDDVAKLVIQKHFLKDLKGNFRKFSMQQFRCVKCNEKYRRPPLIGKCSECGGKLIFTISEGSVVKYLGACIMLCEKYNFSPYLKQTIDMLRINVDNFFGKEKEKQVGLAGFMGAEPVVYTTESAIKEGEEGEID